MLVLIAGKNHQLFVKAALLSMIISTGSVITPALAQVNTPVCQSTDSDPDGDGWGWENSSSCVVDGTDTGPSFKQQHVVCQFQSSDEDGDGWGWENFRSCIVEADTAGAESGSEDSGDELVDEPDDETGVPVVINTDGKPLCLSANSDPDGDGYGWENNTSCVVEGTDAVKPSKPLCTTASADPDGDGWGWENGASCIANGDSDSEVTDNSEDEPVDEEPQQEVEDNEDDPIDPPVDGEDDNNTEIDAKLPADITDLILVTGQSNTLGSNTAVDANLDAPHPRVFAFTDEGWQMAELYQSWDIGGHPGIGDRDATDKIHNNFALHFGKRLAELNENAVVGIVLVSEPGKGIRNWAPGAPGITRVQQKVLEAINSLPHKSALDGILWHQGETDWQLVGTSDVLAEQPAADDYYPVRFAAVLENFRLENWFTRNTPFICGETIKAFGVNTHLNSLNTDNDDYTACVEGEGLPSVTEGGNHFNASALRTLGRRYAERYNQMR